MTCPTPGCGHTFDVVDAGPIADGIYKCDQCNVRWVYGEPGPRTVVSPAHDDKGRAFITLAIQDPITKAERMAIDLDPQFVVLLAADLLALIPDARARACVRLLLGENA